MMEMERREENAGVKKKKKKEEKKKQSDCSAKSITREERRRDDEMSSVKKKKRKSRDRTEENKEVNETNERKQKKRKTAKSAPPAGETQVQVQTPDPLEDLEDLDRLRDEVMEEDILELEQFIPDVRTKATEVIYRLKKYDLPRLRSFRQQGLELRWGRYTHEENLQIRRNADDFLKLTGIESVDELFYPERFPEKKQSLKKIKGQHGFYQRLAEGLQRTCEQVYIRGKKIFDQGNYKGRFSEQDLHELQKLHTLHGNDWKTISKKLDRSVYACQKRFSFLGFQSGPWTPEEMQRIQHSVKKYLRRKLNTSSGPSSGPSLNPSWVQLCSKLPWSKISNKVQTRSWNQCRAKWFSYLRSRLNATQPQLIPVPSVQTRIRLIQTLYEQQVEDDFEIDWVEISKSVGGVTPMCAQRIFHRLKVSRVPGWTSKSFGEMVDVLFEKELPRLQKNLMSALSPGPEPGPGPRPEPGLEPGPEHLSLDQIFPKDQDEFMELDNS